LAAKALVFRSWKSLDFGGERGAYGTENCNEQIPVTARQAHKIDTGTIRV
jgi:hypothetical protein